LLFFKNKSKTKLLEKRNLMEKKKLCSILFFFIIFINANELYNPKLLIKSNIKNKYTRILYNGKKIKITKVHSFKEV
jgi:hypothetical protein